MRAQPTCVLSCCHRFKYVIIFPVIITLNYKLRIIINISVISVLSIVNVKRRAVGE